MRSVAVALLVLAVFVTGNAAVSALYPPYKAAIRDFRSEIFGRPSVPDSASKSDPTDAELAHSIERMTAGIDALVASSGPILLPPTLSGATTASGTLSAGTGMMNVGTGTRVTGTLGTGTSAVPPPETETPEYPLSGVLLARLMPDVFPKKIENRGIFDIYIFRGIEYSTYSDEKSKTKAYAFAQSYGVMLSNLKLVPQAYQLNETDTFFDATFFLNSTDKNDTTIRFVTELEGRAIGIETPKAFYPKLKKMLLQK
jgi:hypothetical protein